MSFAFSAKRDGGDTWERPGSDGIASRTLLDADLHEISPVTFPAYPATNVAVRAVSVPDFEDESDSQAADEIAARADDSDRAVVRTQVLYRRLQLLRSGDHE
jgi:phage head maturation protease